MSTLKSYSWSEGLVAGLIGYAAVTLVVGLVDLALGRSLFHTPDLLGRVVVADAGPVGSISTQAVLAWNALHLLAFLAAGIGLTRLAHFVELRPAAWYLAWLVVLAGFAIAVYVIGTLGAPGETVTWWAVVGATLVAALSMGFYTARRHPELRRRIEELGGSMT